MSFGVIGTNDICILKLGFYEKKMCTETEAVAFFIPPPQYCYWGGSGFLDCSGCSISPQGDRLYTRAG